MATTAVRAFRKIPAILTACCIAAGAMLGGCGDNLSGAEAQQKSRDAAQRAASAGEARATDALVTLVQNSGPAAESTVKASPATYIKENAADEDLTKAIADIGQAANSDVGNSAKSAYKFQLGATQLQLSVERLDTLQEKLRRITTQCAALEALAQQSLALSMQAEAIGSYAKGHAPSRDDAAKAASAADAAKQALQARQKEVDDLKSQIAAKQEQARQIYGATDTAFQAADQMKGQAAINAGAKAMNDRKQADSLMQDVGNLQPQLAEAEGAVQLLQVEADNADRLAKAASAAYDLAVKKDQDASARAAALHSAAADLMNGRDGVAERLKAVREASNGLEDAVKNAADPADAAAGSFAQASSVYGTYISGLSSKVRDQDLPAADPLAQAAKDTRMQALMNWARAAALEQSGRVDLAGALAAESIDRAVRAAGAAGEKLDVKSGGPVAINGSALRKTAGDKLADAINTADSGNRATGKDVELLKWIGYTITASANVDLYVANNDQTALAAAEKARDDVGKSNPNAAASLAWIGK